MSSFKRSDMVYSYSWTAMEGDDPRISGSPDDTLFNRHEGYEVIYLINKYIEARNIDTVANGAKAEKMIREDLPGNVRSQVKVKMWLDENW